MDLLCGLGLVLKRWVQLVWANLVLKLSCLHVRVPLVWANLVLRLLTALLLPLSPPAAAGNWRLHTCRLDVCQDETVVINLYKPSQYPFPWVLYYPLWVFNSLLLCLLVR